MTPPAPPSTATSAPDSDAFQRVGRALIACWPQWSSAPAPDAPAMRLARQRNLLLDETGSDHRPLVELLIDLGHTVRPALERLGQTPLAASVWDTARAPLVHQIVSTRYLQPDVARWAVDVWARALGVSPAPVSREPIASPRVRTSDAPSPASSMGLGGSAAATFGTPPSRSGAPTAGAPKPARPHAPSWAGGPASFGVGARVRPAARQALASSGRLVPGAPRVQGPKYQPVERLAAIVFAVLLAVVSVAMWRALQNRAVSGSAEARVEATAPRTATKVESPTKTPAALPTGATEAPATSGAPIMIAMPSPSEPLLSPMRSGVAGRYRVSQRIRSVDGSRSCESVARALGVGRETVERITHVPGRAEFRIASRGVSGTLDSEGDFVAGPLSGTTNNIPWQFRMRGRFLPNGFTGESKTYTRAIIRWGRTQSCVVSADLSAVRIPG